MSRSTRITAVVLLAAVVGLAGPARAQDADVPALTLGLFGGLVAGASDTGAAAGGSVLVDLHRWLAVEGEGTWLDRGRGASAATAGASLLVNLLPLGSDLVPYASIGGGLYHASFDLADPRFLGPIGPQYAAGTRFCAAPGPGGPGPGAGPRPGFGPGTGTCPADLSLAWGVGDLDDAYARRLDVLIVPDGRRWERASFTDPSLNVGGGVRIDVTEHLSVRPDARAIVVFVNGHTYTLGRVGINVGYRF